MDISQYLSVFMDECQEHLKTLNQSLLALENEPDNSGLLDAIFRAAHTLKGASATMGFNKMASVTHTMEDVLSRLRSKELDVTPEITNVLFDALDLLEELGRGIGEGKEEDIEVNGVVQQLRQFVSNTPKAEIREDRRKHIQLRYTQDEKVQIQQTMNGGYILYHLTVTLIPDCLLKGARVFMILREVQSFGSVIKSNPPTKELEDEQFESTFILGVLSQKDGDELVATVKNIVDVKTVKIEKVEPEQILIERRDVASEVVIAANGHKTDAAASATPAKVAVSQTVRVDIHKLDSLMNLLAELVISRSRLEQISQHSRDSELTEVVEHVTRLTLDLRDQVMKTRMVPIDNVFTRFPRLIRDLSRSLGKEISLIIEGGETELDRTVIDEIGDPLVHLLRNCVDHGIEAAEVRTAKGKPAEGTIRVRAFQKGNSVIVTISDDGKGINVQAVADKAVSLGLISAEELAEKSEDEMVELIFLPGLSTAEKVSDVSGRGVGMDAVLAKIHELKGSVHLETENDVGTEITITLPLTLAIIQTLLVQVGSEIYAIPSDNVESTISLMPKEIKRLRNQEVTMLRGEVLPLVRLQNVLDIQGAKNMQAEELDVVVVRNGERRVGCIVDMPLRQQDVVFKALGNYLGNVPGIAGATILGDGRVALILDFRAVS
jgi:two-component system chemotaxis sensor kinase CheA